MLCECICIHSMRAYVHAKHISIKRWLCMQCTVYSCSCVTINKMHNAIDMHLSLQIASFSHSTNNISSFFPPFVQYISRTFYFLNALLQSGKYFRRKCLELLKLFVPLDLNRSCLHIFNHFCPLHCVCIQPLCCLYEVWNHSTAPINQFTPCSYFCRCFIGVSYRLIWRMRDTHSHIFMWYFVYFEDKNLIPMYFCIFITQSNVSRRTNKWNDNSQTISVVDR